MKAAGPMEYVIKNEFKGKWILRNGGRIRANNLRV